MLTNNSNNDVPHFDEGGVQVHDRSMLTDWTDVKSASFQKEIMSFGHNLGETGLFTDEALISLLESHPSEKMDVCTMGAPDHPMYPNKFRTGDFRDVPGKTLLDAAKAGRVWINLREAMNVHQEYKDVLDQMYGELSKNTGNRPLKPRGGILISSPVARVPYHFDKTETILWHVRGKKRIYLYPLTQKFISDKAYESIVSNDLEDDLPYDKSFDDEAEIIDLVEGRALTWRLNSPHRVDNQSFCVSVTTEYSTQESGMKNAAMLTNATLRYRLGMNPSYERDGQMKRKMKSFAGRVLRKTNLAPDTTKIDMVTFRVDGKAEGFIVDVEPFQRSF